MSLKEWPSFVFCLFVLSFVLYGPSVTLTFLLFHFWCACAKIICTHGIYGIRVKSHSSEICLQASGAFTRKTTVPFKLIAAVEFV